MSLYRLDRALKFDKIRKYYYKRYYEKKLVKIRKQVNELFFNHHLSKSMIAKKKKVSRNFVIRWTKSREQNFLEDARGWLKGKRRKWTKGDEQRIRRIYNYLIGAPSEFYTGATVIEQEWRRWYPDISCPPLRTIGQILSDLGLSSKRRKDRHKGAAKYLCYPEHTIYNLLGGRVLEVDFIGKKYITGRSEPLNFIGFSFKKVPKLRYFKRVAGQTAENFIKQCRHFLEKFERPDFVKVDNCLAVIGSASGKRNISKAMRFLLESQVIPIFAVPRKPFSQASIEGNNSVFSRRFWNKIEFKDLHEVDKKLAWFNRSSQKYTGYQSPKEKSQRKTNFIPRVYFIRQVKEDREQTGKAFIDILNQKVYLPESYINYFVLAEWILKVEKLYVYFEKEQIPKVIKKIPFKINRTSKEKLPKCIKF
jgi:hypothetical protein